MAKSNRNDISIGEDRWLSVPDLNHGTGESLDIDQFILPMEPFWRMLEVHCLNECCGIDAFALWPDDLQKAAREVNDPFAFRKAGCLEGLCERKVEQSFRAANPLGVARPYFRACENKLRRTRAGATGSYAAPLHKPSPASFHRPGDHAYEVTEFWSPIFRASAAGNGPGF